LYNGDSFTNVERLNLSSYTFDYEAAGDEVAYAVYGYSADPANATQPYAAEDIIILSDALCSSSCSLFLEFMHHEANVRVVVAGGRPSTGPMQSSGLSRGALSYDAGTLDSDIAFAQYLLENTTDINRNAFYNTTTDMWVTYAQLNLRDQVRQGDAIPLQFAYDAADCRIFYTPQTFYNYTNLWKYAANAIWSNSSLCVQNSTGYATTNVTDMQGPPTTILPPVKSTTPVPEPPIHLGDVIMSAFSSSDLNGGGMEDSHLVPPPASNIQTVKAAQSLVIGNACDPSLADPGCKSQPCLSLPVCNVETGEFDKFYVCVATCTPVSSQPHVKNCLDGTNDKKGGKKGGKNGICTKFLANDTGGYYCNPTSTSKAACNSAYKAVQPDGPNNFFLPTSEICTPVVNKHGKVITPCVEDT